VPRQRQLNSPTPSHRWCELSPPNLAGENEVLVQAFSVFLLVARLIRADLNCFLPYNLLAPLVAVVILSLVILAAGIASEVSNALFAWTLRLLKRD
jgi:hypothetical protein